MALFDRGSTRTLYGGSLFTRWILAPSSSRSTSSGLDESAHSRRWSPRIQRSPGRVIGSSGGSGTASGSVRPSVPFGVISAASSSTGKPSTSRANFTLCSSTNSATSRSVSHSERWFGVVVGDSVPANLLRRQTGGNVDRYFLQAKLHGGTIARVAHDDDAVRVQHQRLPEAA